MLAQLQTLQEQNILAWKVETRSATVITSRSSCVGSPAGREPRKRSDILEGASQGKESAEQSNPPGGSVGLPSGGNFGLTEYTEIHSKYTNRNSSPAIPEFCRETGYKIGSG